MKMGCEDCGELYDELDLEIDDFDLCDYCGGKLLTVQEGFDKLVQLKREREEYE